MSGALVGEVLDALESGLALEDYEKLVLVAIAEKCQGKDRRGHCRKGRLMAVTGKGKRSVDRYLGVLVAAGLVSVVKQGYKSPHAKEAVATLYELHPIALAEANSRIYETVPSRAARSTTETAPPKVAQSNSGDRATQSGTVTTPMTVPNPAYDRAKSAHDRASVNALTSDDATVDGTVDGNFDRKKPPGRSSPSSKKSATGDELSSAVVATLSRQPGCWATVDDIAPFHPQYDRNTLRAALAHAKRDGHLEARVYAGQWSETEYFRARQARAS